jgi:hypothetical protein
MLLTCHPDTPKLSLDSIEVTARREDNCWHFTFRLANSGALVIPPVTGPGRADGLWQATCFEAFVGDRGASYVEFNFSPSGQFAAYRFDAPREGMRDEEATVAIRADEGNGWFELEAIVTCPALVTGAPLGLSAVIEEDGARKSYWALAHAQDAPDFHNPSCFIARLPE